MSDSKRAKDAEYFPLAEIFLAARPVCECPGCSNPSADVHHMAGRGRYYLAVTTWLAVCRQCHDYIHQHAKEARERGLLFTRVAAGIVERGSAAAADRRHAWFESEGAGCLSDDQRVALVNFASNGGWSVLGPDTAADTAPRFSVPNPEYITTGELPGGVNVVGVRGKYEVGEVDLFSTAGGNVPVLAIFREAAA